MGLRHAVVTSVDRDDLPDYGAGAFVGVIRSIRKLAPGCKVEVLTPDFRGAGDAAGQGDRRAARRLQPQRRDRSRASTRSRAAARTSCARRGSCAMAKEMGGDEVVTKSGLMVGLGEEFDEMVEAFAILREHRRPGPDRRPVPAPDREPPAGGPLLAPRRVRRRSRRRPTRSASSRSPRARSSAPPTTRTSRFRTPRRRLPKARFLKTRRFSATVVAVHCFGVRRLNRWPSDGQERSPSPAAPARSPRSCSARPSRRRARAQGPSPYAPPASNPLKGDGMWIWYVKRASGGKGEGDRRQGSQARGIETVLIKSGDAGSTWSPVLLGARLGAQGPRAAGSAPGSSSTATARSPRPTSARRPSRRAPTAS